MKKVTYAGQSFVTTDAAADTLFLYVGVMDRHGAGESIEIPTVGALGETGSVRLLVWAGSELMCVNEPFDGPDPDTDMYELRRRAESRLGYKTARPDPIAGWLAHVPEDIESV